MKFFRSSHILLDNLGYNSIRGFESNIIVKGVDFADAKKAKKIEYRNDGVYLFKNGHWIRGYYYMANYDIDRYNSYPRFHLFNCSVMENRALYRGNYIWANDKSVNVTNRQTGEINENSTLELCSKCSILLNEKIKSTQEFHDSNGHDEQIETSKVLTLKGYPLNWREIASNFKIRNGLTCKACNYSEQSQINKWFFDVDHINGNKQNCEDINLQVLCKLCHVYKDQHHLQQAIKYPNRNSTLQFSFKKLLKSLRYLTKLMLVFNVALLRLTNS